MNMIELLEVVEEIGATSSTTEKLALLKKQEFNPDMQAMLQATLDPTRRYFMKKVPERAADATGTGSDLYLAIEILNMMWKRSISGGQAQRVVQELMNAFDPRAAELFKRMILKDLRASLGVTLTNKVWKGVVPEEPYMRCSLEKEAKMNDWPWEQGVISQEKADGMFVNVDVSAGGVSITTRAGTEVDTAEFADICDVVAMAFSDVRLTGELLVIGPLGEVLDRATGNGMLNHVQKGGSLDEGHYAILQVWDQIPLEFVKPGGVYEVAYAKRFMEIVRALPGASHAPAGSRRVSTIPYRIVRSKAEAMRHYFELTSRGKEGTVVCHPEAPWFDGTSRFKVKMKMAVDCDLRIKGFTAGKGKNAKTFGAIECASECGELQVNVSGFDDATRLDIHNRRAELLDGIMTVTSNGIQKSRSKTTHSLFLPVFSELRPDRTSADDLARIRAIFDSAMKGEEETA